MGFTALIAGGLGAAGAIGGSLISSNAAKDASNAQVQLGQQALQTQKDLYNTGLSTAQSTLSPFISAGQSVLPTLKGLITPGPNQNALLSQTPGFQFQSQYGTMAATNALASKGLGGGGGPLAAAISQYNNGLAGTTWQNIVQALQGYASMGAGAGGTLGQAALNGAISSGNAQAGTLTNIGNAQASGILGSANALTSGITGGTNALTTASIIKALSGGGGAGNPGLYASPNSLIPGASGPGGGPGSFIAAGGPNGPGVFPT